MTAKTMFILLYTAYKSDFMIFFFFFYLNLFNYSFNMIFSAIKIKNSSFENCYARLHISTNKMLEMLFRLAWKKFPFVPRLPKFYFLNWRFLFVSEHNAIESNSGLLNIIFIFFGLYFFCLFYIPRAKLQSIFT